MRKNYKPIGDHIKRVEKRNTDLKVTKLLGLSMTKEFRETTSNVVGTDMSVYKVMSKYQFACDFMSPIRVNKLPVVLKLDDEPNLVSPAYPVFEVKDKNALDPEYLMMWFRRPEFDRYATFKCDAAIRGGYDWEELCETLIPVPTINKQREIVAEYNTIQSRINLNRQLIQKLEEAAQTIYREWFVDGVDVENLPEGWSEKPFTEVVKLSGGGTPDTNNESYWNGDIPFFTPADVANSYYSISTEKRITETGLKNSSTKLYPKNTVFVTARGTVGAISIAGYEMAMNQSCYAITAEHPFYVHQLSLGTMIKLKNEAVGAVFGALVTKDFDAQMVIDPPIELKEKFEKEVFRLYEYLLLKTTENQKLSELKDLLLSKLATIEN
ncbi:restriction endonuclease subunit S [Agriterribacter sp.]|uniref:restriction endonuclease subunit S n=1 Tax=Agriterribacter sp. TaxID=2821509 RepID=UPI002B7CA827|nr:restriction endonuclease subunit S [Agriterribacter sp.]HRO44825.1 restriction endonuclease subunit S [Agriterribacter sp.]HRQ18043.1 restriction endonuclease subunit S [Agriterribacter sp.]